ncbi:MAG: sugar ABC transporter ATP-binding protein [Pleomorphochaeta sp.]
MNIKMRGIDKFFGTNQVLDKANFTLKDGEIHALMGENGAGKSTMMKILTGVYTKNSGQIFVDKQEVSYTHPKEAEKDGIVFVYQELNTVLDMSVQENLFLGKEIKKGAFHVVDNKLMNEKSKEVLDRLGLNINPNTLVSSLSVGQQQLIEIAKALLVNSKVIILDEPTAALTDKEVDKLFSVVRKLKDEGVSFIYISHRLEEIFKICDRITILRDGKYIGDREISKTNNDEIIKMMIGRDLGNMFRKEAVEIGSTLLKVSNLSNSKLFNNVSFEVHSGEVLGVAGLMGAGRTEIMKTLFGNLKADSGEIVIDEKVIDIHHYNSNIAMKYGFGFITEDRKEEGLMLSENIKTNIALTNFPKILSNSLVINPNKELDLANKAIDELKIKCTSFKQTVNSLSGGNQQKVVFAKWLYTEPKVLLLDEPTRGVDVGAKQEIYSLITALAKKGTAIIMVSSDLPEVIGMSDRVMVIHQGKVGGILNKEKISQENIMTLATGGSVNE